jgi:hypothetical protein
MSIVTPIWILSSEPSAASDLALSRFANFIGPKSLLISSGEGGDGLPPNLPHAAIGAQALALSFQTFQRYAGIAWFEELIDGASAVLVYGFKAEGTALPQLERMTSGAYTGISEVSEGDHDFIINAILPGGPYPVSGLSFQVRSKAQPVFIKGAGSRAESAHISVAGKAYFASVPRKNGDMFLLAEEEVVDIDAPLTPRSSLRTSYAQLIALSVFFRATFGALCWTAPTIGANFTIDDPNLKARYGHVHFKRLAADLNRTGVALTVAFIPFNHRRSSARIVEMLRTIPDRFSIAVHGCDHTNGEYASTDRAWLEGTTTCALDRMKQHRRNTGMLYDNVMVFPQGKFSTTAIGVLKRCGFLAAVNSNAWPTDWERYPAAIRDAIDVAVSRYSGFPIFVRRYPVDVFDYAFDAFFQKPVLGVEHHRYFRNGFAPLENLAVALRRAIPNLKWMPLGRTVVSSYLLRNNPDGTCSIRHFVPEFRYKNETSIDLECSVEKPESEDFVTSVLVNGNPVPFELSAGNLRYVVVARPGEEIEARVIYRGAELQQRQSPWPYRLRVCARRYLSDLRDNGIARRDRILATAKLPKWASRLWGKAPLKTN